MTVESGTPPQTVPVNEEGRWPPETRCNATVEHLGVLYGCVYGEGHHQGMWASAHGASVEDAHGHTTHDLMWGGPLHKRLVAVRGEWWSPEVEERLQAEGVPVRDPYY